MTTCAPQQSNHHPPASAQPVITSVQPYNLASYLGRDQSYRDADQAYRNAVQLAQYGTGQLHKSDSAGHTRAQSGGAHHPASQAGLGQGPQLQGYSHYETLPGANREAVTVHRPPDRPPLKKTQSLGPPAVPDRTIMATDIRAVDLTDRGKGGGYGDPFYDLDLHYITERIIAMSFPIDGHEAAYKNNMKDLARMLQTKHGHNYMVLNLSERRSDLTLYNRKVLEYGWPEDVAPPLERLCSLCKEMDTWLNSDPQRVVVLHCKGKKGRTGVVIAAFMHYSNICASADQALDRFAMKRFYEDKLGQINQPSQKRYVHYFAGLLTGAIKINSSPLYLHQIILHGVPTFDDRTNGCRPFVKVYLAMEPVHTSGVYNLTDGMQRICFNVEPGIQLRGDVMIKAYHKRPRQQARDVIFRTQFHTCAISKFGYTLTKAELDDACTDRRFPDTGKVELLFSPGPQKQGPHFYHDPPPLLVDDSRDTIVRWDSYSDFTRQQNAPRENGEVHDHESLEHHVQGPLDGSLYATVTKQRVVTRETTSSTSAAPGQHHVISGALPVQHVTSTEIKDSTHNSMDSGISNTTTGGNKQTGVTGVNVSVITSQPTLEQQFTSPRHKAQTTVDQYSLQRSGQPKIDQYSHSNRSQTLESQYSSTRHARAHSTPRNEFSSLRQDQRNDQQELDAVLNDLLGSDGMMTSPRSRQVTSYNSWESRSGTDTSGYVKRSYQYTDSSDPSKNISKTEYSSDMDALTRLLTAPGGYTQKADALDLAMPDNSSTWLEEQQRKLRKSHSRPRTEQERKLVEELKSAQDKFIGTRSTSGEDRRSSYYTYVDDQSGYMSEPEGTSYRNKRYSKGYGEPRYNTLQYSTTLVTDMNKPPASPGNQRSMSPAVPSRTSSRDAMTRSRSATRGEWTSHSRPLHRQNSDLSHDRYNRSPKGSPARPESPLNYRPTLHSASSTLERSEVREVRAVPPPRSTSFTYEPRVYTEQRVLMRNMPKQHETSARYLETDTKQYLMKDRLEGPTEADPTIYSQEDLENALRQLEDLQSLTLDAEPRETRAPPDGNPDLHNSFGSSNADSSVSSLSRDVFVLDKAHDVSVSSVSSSEKVHGTTPVHVQAVRVAPDVNTAALTPGTTGTAPGKPGKPRAEVTTCTRTVKHPRDKDKVSDEARKHYNSLGERLEELERSLQAAQNAISAEAALRREKELRDAREKDEKDRAEKSREARETRERLERESLEREERLRREREVIEREIREREIIHIREKDRGDDERLAREARDRERLLELERKEQELLEKERQLRALESAPPAPRTPDVVDSGTRTITRTYMIEPSTQAVDFKTKAKRRRSSVEDIYLLKPIGVHTLETDEPDAIHEVRAASTPVENRSATLPSASSEVITPPFPVSPGTPYVNKGILTPGGASHKVVEATVHRSGFGGHTESAPGQHFSFPEGGAQASGAGLQGGVVSESHQYGTLGGAHSPGPQKLVQIHKTTTETRRTDSPVLQHVSPAQQRHLESQRVEGRRFETSGADVSPGFGEHFEVTTIRKEHQEHGPEVFVESGGSSLNQSFETSSASAGGSYSYQTETRQTGVAAESTSSLPHGARMNTSVGSGGGGAGGHEYHTRTTTVTQESSPKQQQFATISGSSGYTNEARNRSGGGASGSGAGGSVVHEYYSNTSSAHNENSPNQYSFESSPGVQRSGGYSYSTSSQFSEGGGGGGGGGGGKSVSISEGTHHGGESSGKQNQYSWSVEGGSSGGGGSRMHQSYSESSSVAGGHSGGQQSGMNHSWSGEGYSTRSGEGYSTKSGEGYSAKSGEGYSTKSGEGYSTRSGEGYSGRSVSESGGAGGGYSYQYSSQNGAQSPPTLTVDTSYVSHTRNNSSLSGNSQFSPASPNTMAQLRSQLSKSESSGGQTYLSPNRQGSPATSTYTGMSRQASLQSLAFIDTVDMINHTPKFVKDLSKFWYKPNISREEAIVLLKDKPSGTFVVRDSNSFPGAFGLALKVESLPPNVQSKGDPETELVRHFLIESTSKGVRMKGCNNEPVFASLSTLIYQHTITPLALPCKLVLPESAVVELDDTDSKEMVPGSAQALLAQGAACNVLYIFSVDTESLTGPQALSRAMAETKKVQPKTTEVHFKVSSQGVTLTDNLRKLFFRRHYPVNTVTYCGMDPDDTRWLTKQDNGKEITAKVFGFVARKPGSQTDNSCHIFAELDPEQPASAIVNFVTKVMIGSHQGKKS